MTGNQAAMLATSILVDPHASVIAPRNMPSINTAVELISKDVAAFGRTSAR